MANGMRAPSTKTGFLLLLEDMLAGRPLLATAAAREGNGAARATRIIVLSPGCVMDFWVVAGCNDRDEVSRGL